MPPFANVLTKDEVKDVVAFLASCRTDTAPGCRRWTASQPSQ
jgi:cytochrome c1